MENRHKVVILPQTNMANRLNQICKLDHFKGYFCELKGELVIALEVPVPQTMTATHKCSDGKEYWNGFLNPQHLYFLSNEKPVYGDWCVGIDRQLYQFTKDVPDITWFFNRIIIGKVIATTDPQCILPGIQTSFLEAFVKAQGKIDWVELEDRWKPRNSSRDGYYVLQLTQANEVIVTNYHIQDKCANYKVHSDVTNLCPECKVKKLPFCEQQWKENGGNLGYVGGFSEEDIKKASDKPTQESPDPQEEIIDWFRKSEEEYITMSDGGEDNVGFKVPISAFKEDYKGQELEEAAHNAFVRIHPHHTIESQEAHFIEGWKAYQQQSESEALKELLTAINHLDALDTYHSLGDQNLTGVCIENLKVSLRKLRTPWEPNKWLEIIKKLHIEACSNYNQTLPKTEETNDDSWYFEGAKLAYDKLIGMMTGDPNYSSDLEALLGQKQHGKRHKK